jgi:hypothetical protein
MGTVAAGREAGTMTTSTLPTRATAPRVDSTAATATPALDRVPLLALAAPLLLFAHGILTWVDGLDTPEGTPTGGGVLAVVAGGILLLSVAGFASLASTLVSRVAKSELVVPVTLLGAFGAGATGAVWIGRSIGWLADPLPPALAVGGAVLAGVALAVALAFHAAEGRMPSGSLALAGAAGALLALPLGLEPLGALVLLIALGPLTRGVEEPHPAS